MSGFYKKAVVWLGLNEEYPDDLGPAESAPNRPNPRPEPGQQPRPERPAAAGQSAPARPQVNPSQVQNATVRPLDPAPLGTSRLGRETSDGTGRPDVSARSDGTVRAIPIDDEPNSSRQESTAIGTVRAVAVPKTVKPEVIVPQSFNDAQRVADTFREPKPVIVNMQSAERDLARRLIDFSSGLCYGLGGQMEKVAKDVYLLTPDDIEVADEDRDNF